MEFSYENPTPPFTAWHRATVISAAAGRMSVKFEEQVTGAINGTMELTMAFSSKGRGTMVTTTMSRNTFGNEFAAGYTAKEAHWKTAMDARIATSLGRSIRG